MERKRGFIMMAIVVLFLAWTEVCGAGEVTKPKSSKSERAELSTQKEEAQPEEIVYKFKNSQEMAEFQRMYQQVQFISTRIAVLQDYLVQERANLDQLNAQMYLKFKFLLEPDKQYELDVANMLIKEIPPVQ